MTQDLHAAAIEKAQTVWLENSNRFQGFQYEDRHTIRDMRKPAGDQIVWELAQTVNTPAEYERCHSLMMVEIDRLQWAEVVKAILAVGISDELTEMAAADARRRLEAANDDPGMPGDALDPWAEGLWRAACETLAIQLWRANWEQYGDKIKCWSEVQRHVKAKWRKDAQAIMEGRDDA